MGDPLVKLVKMKSTFAISTFRGVTKKIAKMKVRDKGNFRSMSQNYQVFFSSQTRKNLTKFGFI